MTMSAGARWRALLNAQPCLVTPGCFDALSARVAEKVGFEALAISGFGVEAALLGRPDLGLLTLSELVDQARRIVGAVDVPITCDAETGFGGVHNIARLVRDMQDCGIAGIQLEDQANPKRCPALEGRVLVSLEEQIVRLKAARAARTDPDFVIIARSDADVVSYEELVLRSNRYLQAGADLVMPLCFVLDGHPVAGMRADDQMDLYARLVRAIDGPVKGVLIPEGYAVTDMAAIGYRVMGLSAVSIEAATNAMFEALTDLKERGTTAKYRTAHPPTMPAPGGIMNLMRLPEYLQFERRLTDEED